MKLKKVTIGLKFNKKISETNDVTGCVTVDESML